MGLCIIVVKSSDPEIKPHGFISCSFHLLVVLPWASYFFHVRVFLSCKMEISNNPSNSIDVYTESK